MGNVGIDFESLREGGLSFTDSELVDLFESALESLDQSAIPTQAYAVASQLKTLVPISNVLDGQMESCLERLWDILFQIARRIPHRHLGQTLLVTVIQALAAWPTPDEPEKPGDIHWRDLLHLGRCLRDSWIDPTFETVEGEEEEYTLDQWLNFNSFAARIFGKQLGEWINFPIWQLRHGLEEQDMKPCPELDHRVAVASEWLVQGAPGLLRHSLLSSSRTLDEAKERSYSAGELFAGDPGLNLERWGFWKRRLQQVRQTLSDESVQKMVDEAVGAMSAAEMAVANIAP